MRWSLVWILAFGCQGDDVDDTGDIGATEYLVGTADDEFGAFPFPPWDVIGTDGANVGLNGQFVQTVCERNVAMSCELVSLPYSACGTGEPFRLGQALTSGQVDACASWAQTPARRVAGATFGTPVQSQVYAPATSMIRNPAAAVLADSDDALAGLADDSIGLVSGFAADATCLGLHYASATNAADLVTTYADQAVLFSDVAAGTIDYAWVLVTEADFPPTGTALAHDPAADKAESDLCAGPYALMLDENSDGRPGLSTQLAQDATCGAALLAAHSELEADVDLTAAGASNSSVSNTDFRELACGEPVPVSGGGSDVFSDLCALDDELPLPSSACLATNGF